MSTYGKLSLKGSLAFEKRMTTLLNNIKNDIKNQIDDNLYEAVLLIGGYGRSEGGVIKIKEIEYPHNNLDFIVISKNINKNEIKLLEKKIKNIFNTNIKAFKVFIEFTIISSKNLQKCPSLVITYDMKFGHKLIIGDAKSLLNNKNFELEKIEAWDIRNLMVNRGTLLIINDLILKKQNLEISDKKIIIKHLMKAVIGYGDALLFYLGEYNYSYLTKQKNMQKNKFINENFKVLYNNAINFRFEANYEQYLEIDLLKYQKEIKKHLFQIHYLCEKKALKIETFQWTQYLELSTKKALYNKLTIKEVLKSIYFLSKNFPKIKILSFRKNLELKMLGMQKLMPIIFPFVIFDIKNNHISKTLADFFEIQKQESYKKEYLLYWKKHINSNFEEKDFNI